MLLLLALLSVAQAEAPVVTLDMLRASPGLYAGKTVLVSGQMDQCYGWGCSLCPLEATVEKPERDRCLAIELADGWLAESIYRFADIKVRVTFDPACLGPDAICLDRATILSDGRVVEVTRRRTSRDGLWLSKQEPLRELAGEAARPLLAALHDAAWPETPARPTRVFVTAATYKSANAALVCTLPLGSGAPDAWPTSYEAATLARSAVDKFKCHHARRRDGRWHILVE